MISSGNPPKENGRYPFREISSTKKDGRATALFDRKKNHAIIAWLAIRDPNQSSLKAVFFAYYCKFSLVVRQVQHRSPLQQSAKKYGFKVLCILTAINLGKSRQTNEVILGVLQESLTPILQILRR